MSVVISLRERALRFLSRREYSRSELSRKLTPYTETPESLASLLDDLSERHFLSDARYAKMRVKSRAQRYGNLRLSHELRVRGIGDELISESLAGTDDETARACRILQRKFGDLAASCPEERARRARFLMRRGFSGETIRKMTRCDFESD
ncbi:MAG: recombination regulator RecX [Candidatus Accumulibacter sp.]|jgi:regulatory protein|nr:recombination regulator RecX [Accumulibacter sp.]